MDNLPTTDDYYEPQIPEITSTPSTLTLKYSSQLVVELDKTTGALWGVMTGAPRPCFNPQMLRSLISLTSDIENKASVFHDEFGVMQKLNYFVMTSGTHDTFSLGGDLSLFSRLINDRDLKGMKKYADACVDPMARIARGFNLPLVTISLVQGRALGGGFEAALSADLIIAEESAKFGLPEIMFGLFPGMGATTFLRNKVGERVTKRIMDSGTIYSAQEMYDIGIIDHVAKDGEGRAAVHQIIKARAASVNGHGAMAEARRISRGDLTQELFRITNLWANTAMKVNPRDLAMMDVLVRRQNKLVTNTPISKIKDDLEKVI
jgi:DSF synthase